MIYSFGTWEELLRHLMKHFNVSSYALEKDAGINSAIISNILNRRTIRPNTATIKKLENFLKIKIAYDGRYNIFWRTATDIISCETQHATKEELENLKARVILLEHTLGSIADFFNALQEVKKNV